VSRELDKLRREARRQDVEAGAELYHVTYYRNLESIAEHGLVAGHGGAIGRGGYSGHSKGRVFLTEVDGVFFWMDRYEQFAQHDSEDPLNDGFVPIVLMIADGVVDQLIADELGSRDALGGAYYVEDLIITPDELLVWNGREWTTIDDWQSIDPQSSFAWVDDEDFDEGGFWQFGDLNDLPLLPPEARK
jgi:hypothetical protein